MTMSGATEDTSDAISADALMVLYPRLRWRNPPLVLEEQIESGRPLPDFQLPTPLPPQRTVRVAGGRDAERG